jgi:hypothetical protein
MPAYTVLCLAVLVFRLATGLSGHPAAESLANFSPMAALFLCGGLFLKRRHAWVLPLAVFLVSDLILNWHYNATHPDAALPATLASAHLLARYVFFLLLFGAARFLRGAASWPVLIGSAVSGSFLFYLATNTVSWLSDPAYAKTAAGWVQALTWGLPGYPPSFLFFRNTLLGDIVFTVAIALVLRPAPAARSRHGIPLVAGRSQP